MAVFCSYVVYCFIPISKIGTTEAEAEAEVLASRAWPRQGPRVQRAEENHAIFRKKHSKVRWESRSALARMYIASLAT